MKLGRLLVAGVIVLIIAGVAYVAQKAETASGTQMTEAGEKFIKTLGEDQKKKTIFGFDDKERLNWHFVPLQDKDKKSTRKGMPLADMSKEQRAAALELLKAGTSAQGYKEATTIMSLESILHDLEKGGTNVRDPDWYFFTIFGTPAKTGKWGWRVEGHHLSLNFVVDNGKVAASTPAFFGANPATVKGGAKDGQRTLAEADDLARDLFNMLDDGQKKVALQKDQFPEVQGKTPAPKVGDPVGVAAGKMTDKQKALLMKLVESYANRLPSDVAASELSQLKEAGVDKIHFGYAGGLEAGKPHSYRIQGPTFIVEFLNMQADSAKNPANHIHSCWRNTKGDLGVAAK